MITSKKIVLSICLVSLVGLSTFIPNIGLAQGIIPSECIGKQSGNECGIVQILELANNLYKEAFKYVGSIALLFFMYGGIVWLTSAGNAQRVEHGRKVLEGALIGLVLIFSSWIIIYFVTAALTGKMPGSAVKVFPDIKNVERDPL